MGERLKRGTRVGWTLKDGTQGQGVTASDEEDGKVLVAVDPLQPAPGLRQSSLEFHPVIYCTVTWLTVLA